MHKTAVTAKANPLKRAFDVVRTTGIVAAKTATQCLMATTLTCIKERLPISKFAPLLALEKFLGVDQIVHKYNHSRYVHDVVLAQGCGHPRLAGIPCFENSSLRPRNAPCKDHE